MSIQFTKSDVKRIANIILSIKELKIRLSKTSNEILKEVIELKIMFYESELLKYHSDLVSDIQAECNRGLSIEEIATLYETQISREKRKRQLMSDNMIKHNINLSSS